MKHFNALHGFVAVAAMTLVCFNVNAGDANEPCKDSDSQGAAQVTMAEHATTLRDDSTHADMNMHDDTTHADMKMHGDSAEPAMGGEGDDAIGGNAPNPDPDRSASTVIDDAAITTKVKTKLLADTAVSGLKIDVDTRSGVVYLTGDNIDSQGAIDQAMQLARSTDGVKSVVSKMAVRDVKNSP